MSDPKVPILPHPIQILCVAPSNETVVFLWVNPPEVCCCKFEPVSRLSSWSGLAFIFVPFISSCSLASFLYISFHHDSSWTQHPAAWDDFSKVSEPIPSLLLSAYLSSPSDETNQAPWTVSSHPLCSDLGWAGSSVPFTSSYNLSIYHFYPCLLCTK